MIPPARFVRRLPPGPPISEEPPSPGQGLKAAILVAAVLVILLALILN